MRQAIASEATKSAPPIAVSVAATVGGLTLNEWVAITTIAYVIIQAAVLIWRWYREYKASK